MRAQMRESLNAYLSQHLGSSLNLYRDLYLAQLERNINLELQKFSLSFKSLQPEQKTIFLSELDKAVTNINLMRGIIADINKELTAEQVRNEYFESVAIEKLKEKEESQERKLLASLGAAIEIAALKTSASMNEEQLPSVAAVSISQEIDKKFIQGIKLLDEQLIEITEILLNKAIIVDDADSKLADSGSTDEDGKLSKSSVLLNVIFWPENIVLIANQLGISSKDVNFMNLTIIGNELVFNKDNEKRMDFSIIQALFEESTRDHATEMSPILLGSVEAIRILKEKGEHTRRYLQEQQLALDTGITKGYEWRTAILAERGITIDPTHAAEQIAEIQAAASPSFAEQIMREQTAQSILMRRAEEFAAEREVIEKHPALQRYSLLTELITPKPLRKVKTIDKSAPDLKAYLDDEEKLKNKFTKLAEESKAARIPFSKLVETSKNESPSLPYPPLKKGG
jgi:hypothetical protein